jgi:hypothetical protein
MMTRHQASFSIYILQDGGGGGEVGWVKWDQKESGTRMRILLKEIGKSEPGEIDIRKCARLLIFISAPG